MKQQRILWADDEIELLHPYVLFLQQKGYEVVTANNGTTAIELCNSQVFDIVFLDENMPGLSGLETLSEIKAGHPTLPVVMVTKSEEENVMDLAIGEKIADYLIKPVHPNQILLTLKKHIHQRDIVSEHTNSNYRQEFSDIAYMIDTATTLEEFFAIHKVLVHWDLELQGIDSSMREMLLLQKEQANNAFAKFISRSYEKWFADSQKRPLLSPDIFKSSVFPVLDKGEKLFMIVIDNFRYDQWKVLQPMLSEWFNVTEDKLYCSILPTATQYARNAIFSGLMPLQIKEMFPDLWVEEEDEEGKNLNEEQLVQTLLNRYRKPYRFTYNKVNESDYCEKLIGRLKGFNSPLNIIVINFIDMLSHSRTDSKMMRELMGDDAAYLSLTQSWFKHSNTAQLFQRIAELGYKMLLTTDHGTICVNNPVQILGDKNTNTNLRYKVGKSLACKDKDVFIMEKPRMCGLPEPNLSSTYIYATGNKFFAYPNNFNYYAQYYRNTFQHGGISMEEMLVPLIMMEPK